MYRLEQSIIRILDVNGVTVGTGFVVADYLAVTCAHVVQAAGSNCDQTISIQFHNSEGKQIAHVLNSGWSSPTSDDVAFLHFEYLPKDAASVVLGFSDECEGHSYSAFGFARLADYEDRKVRDTLDGIVSVREKRKHPMLQLKGEGIDRGLSGSPVLDNQMNRVVGMVSEYKDNEHIRFAWATTADTLLTLQPTLKLWPADFGPKELDHYLQYLIDSNKWLILTDGREVLLEQVYVTLRADEMSTIERQAEYDLYLEDVATFKQETQLTITDRYAEFAVLRKTIARHPKMLMLEARKWTRLFGERDQGVLTLAEVVKRHSRVVLLGDPGSGKTTLGRWLILQFARALRQQENNVLVRSETVRPGTDTDQLLDMGSTCLPIFIRIADYAHARWDGERGDNKLLLEDFLITYHPRNLSFEMYTAAKAIIQKYLAQGQALVILDGLDEVADPGQRKAVMQAVKHFIQAQSPKLGVKDWTGNRVLLTSRVVGYQFDPLIDLPHYTIEEMNDMAIAAFCRAWMNHVVGSDLVEADKQANRLKDTIFDHAHPGVRTLAGNPLLLTILAQVYWSSAERMLPTKRVILFEEATRAFYSQREEFWERVGIPPLRLSRALSAVAAYIHANQVTGFIEEGEVREQLRSILTDPEQVEAVLEAAREVSGFLVARGEGVYGFLHRSLQEYFAAKYLVDRPECIVNNLSDRLLNPTWREPIILAIGIVSQRRYPDSRRHLAEVFDAVLGASDPAGDFLPRRELLTAAACAECERVPLGIGSKITERLLAFYIPRGGRLKSPVLRERIQNAFTTLIESPARNEFEIELCNAVQSQNFEIRYAAAELIGKIKFDTPAIARALVSSWRTYANPAASLLIALNEMIDRKPHYFQSDFLPLRQAVEDNPLLWKIAEDSWEWQSVITALYLPTNADFKAHKINRDSPLTPQVLAALQQIHNPELLMIFHRELRSMVSRTDTVEARDAIIILSALGDPSWLDSVVSNLQDKTYQGHSLIFGLAGILVRNAILALELTWAIDSVLDDAIDRRLHHAFAQSLKLAHNLKHKSDSEVEEKAANSKDEDDNEGEDDDYDDDDDDFDSQNEAFTSGFIRALDSAIVFAQAIDHTNDPNFHENLKYALAILSDVTISIMLDYNKDYGPIRNIDFDTIYDITYDIVAILKSFINQDDILNTINLHRNFELDKICIKELTHDPLISFGSERILEFDPTCNLQAGFDFAQDINLNPLLGNALSENLHQLEPHLFDSDDYFLDVYGKTFRQISKQIALIKEYIVDIIELKNDDIIIKNMIDLLSYKMEEIKNYVNKAMKLSIVWETLTEKRWSLRNRELDEPAKLEPPNSRKLSSLIVDLASLNDAKREQARKLLLTVNKASVIGQDTIEQLANMMHFYMSYPEISSQLDWGLKKIIYDTPKWVSRWIEQARIPDQAILPRTILRRMYNVTPEVFEVILHNLQNEMIVPNLKTMLLKAISWQARLGQIPKGKQTPLQEHLLLWLNQETEPKTRNAIIEVLGNCQDLWGDISDTLLALFSHPKLGSDFPALCKALVRQAMSDKVFHKLVSGKMYSACPRLEAVSALISLRLVEKLDSNKQKNVDMLLSWLCTIVSDSTHRLIALLEAGTNDDIWDETYHGVLVDAVRTYLEDHENLLPVLLARLHQAFLGQDWPTRRIVLAAVAACIEVMPVSVRRACSVNLEELIVKGITDAESSTSRRFALTALSYLRTVTPVVGSALLTGCRDTRAVQRDTVIAASRFQSMVGNLPPSLVAALTSESVSTAYTAVRLLGALGTSMASEGTNLREQIIEKLVDALKNPSSQREVLVLGDSRGKLEDSLYTALLQSAGWIG